MNLHVLHIPRKYPSKLDEINSIFFKDQVESIANDDKIKIGVLSVIQKSVFSKVFLKNFRLFLFTEKNTINKVFLIQRYIFTIPAPYYLKLWYRCFVGYKLFKQYIKINGLPDILHLQTYEMGWLGQKIYKNYKVPYILTEHMTSFYSDIPKWVYKMTQETYRISKYNIAVSENFKQLLSKKFSVPFHYIPNMVDTDFFNPSEQPEPKDFVFFNVGYCNPRKQQSMLIDSFCKAFKKSENVKLIIGGDGPELLKLKNKAIQLDRSEQIKFLGMLSKLEVRNYMQKCSSFVLSSKIETFGVVLIEAMSCGKPCVSTRSNGPESIITSPIYGELCDNNVTSLSNALRTVYEKEYNSNDIRDYILSTFSCAAVSLKLIDIYYMIFASKN